MTAEIAILNRTAVALAADSIVTLSSSGHSGSKTYDSAEKIFELSRFRPVGLMVYNNTELFRMPLEILAREYRQRESSDIICLTELWPKFQGFLLEICAESEFVDSLAPFSSLIGEALKDLNSQLLNVAVNRL